MSSANCLDQNTSAAQPCHQSIQEIPVAQIRPSTYQVRKSFDFDELNELTASIKTYGVLQPIKVVRRIDDDNTPFYELVFGERRWRAATKANLDTIPAIVTFPSDVDEVKQTVQGIVENLHRADLNPMETLAGFKTLMSLTKSTWTSLPTRVGKARSTIHYYRALDQMPREIQEWVAAGQLTMKHVRALSKIKAPDTQVQLAHIAIEEGMAGAALDKSANYIQSGYTAESAVIRPHNVRMPLTRSKPAAKVADTESSDDKQRQQERDTLESYKAVMEGISGQRREDLIFEVENRDELSIPDTCHAAAIMRRNPVISATAAVTYAQLCSDHDLSKWSKNINQTLSQMRLRIGKDELSRPIRTTLLAAMIEQSATLQEMIEIIQQAEIRARA